MLITRFLFPCGRYSIFGNKSIVAIKENAVRIKIVAILVFPSLIANATKAMIIF